MTGALLWSYDIASSSSLAYSSASCASRCSSQWTTVPAPRERHQFGVLQFDRTNRIQSRAFLRSTGNISILLTTLIVVQSLRGAYFVCSSLESLRPHQVGIVFQKPLAPNALLPSRANSLGIPKPRFLTHLFERAKAICARS